MGGTSSGAVNRPGRWVAGVLPLLVALVLVVFGAKTQAAAAAAVGIIVLILIAAGIDVASRVERVALGVARGVSGVLGGVAFLVAVVPAWLLGRLVGRVGVGGGGSVAGWQVAAGGARDSEPGSIAGSGPERVDGRARSGLLRWVGITALLLAADFGGGWLWNEVGPARRGISSTPVEGSEGTAQRREGVMPRDPRADLPAMASYPWREEYFDEIQRQAGGYWPFTEWRPNSYRSRLVNIDDWVRKSYTPRGDISAMPVVWFFGGSTTWGEGQRDEYTIASWVARIAEERGTPVVVRNYGQRGWTHFQEMILFEQRLAAESPPDLAVFYDGANEITTQSLLNEAVPAHTFVYAYAQRLAGSAIATRLVQRPDALEDPWSLWDAYTSHSLVAKVVRRLVPPAGAQVPDDPKPVDPGSAFTAGQKQNADGATFEYLTTPADGTDAGQVYERGKQMTLALAERYAVQTLFFWQPMRYKGPPELNAIAELTESTIDISDSLVGHDDVFIDGGHTNEEGARLVAERIWQHLGPKVDAWYVANP